MRQLLNDFWTIVKFEGETWFYCQEYFFFCIQSSQSNEKWDTNSPADRFIMDELEIYAENINNNTRRGVGRKILNINKCWQSLGWKFMIVSTGKVFSIERTRLHKKDTKRANDIQQTWKRRKCFLSHPPEVMPTDSTLLTARENNKRIVWDRATSDDYGDEWLTHDDGEVEWRWQQKSF